MNGEQKRPIYFEAMFRLTTGELEEVRKREKTVLDTLLNGKTFWLLGKKMVAVPATKETKHLAAQWVLKRKGRK